MIKDHYRTLGVQVTATREQIKTVFKRLALEHHPDRHGGDKAKEALFKEMSESYDVLCDSEKRAKYDRVRMQQAQGTAPPPRPATPQTPPPPRPAPRWTPPVSKPMPQPSGGGGAAAGLGGGLFTIGLGLLGLWAAAQSGGGGQRGSGGSRPCSYYDPAVNRYRGTNGRFSRF